MFGKDELMQMLAKSRESNAKKGITGILLYKDGNFMQVIEGEEVEVNKLLEKISADPRHKRILRLHSRRIKKREFTDWSMAFRDLDDLDLHKYPGYSDFLNMPLDSPAFEEDSSLVHKLIANFVRINR